MTFHANYLLRRYQILFSGKNKKNIINLSSAELAKRVVKVKSYLLILKLRLLKAKTDFQGRLEKRRDADCPFLDASLNSMIKFEEDAFQIDISEETQLMHVNSSPAESRYTLPLQTV